MNDGIVSEANGAMQVAVTKSGDLQTTITVSIETVEGTGVCEQKISCSS